MKNIQRHFSTVAEKYREIRTTDKEPVRYITGVLGKKLSITAADIGCGAGRYDLQLFYHLGKRLFLHCVDANQHMLQQLQKFISKRVSGKFKVIKASAHNIPLMDNFVDCIFTFNAIHHFQLPLFFQEASRLLKPKGKMFIYTRLRSQNERTIWGQFFPSFSKKETRLYTLSQLKSAVKASSLSITEIKHFDYARTASLGRLIHQANNKHYSTFFLYSKNEFAKALSIFKRKITQYFPNPQQVTWHDENILLVLTKT